MKKQSQHSFSPLDKGKIENLTETEKETLTIGFNRPRIFSAAELWDIQRRGRTMVSRRNFAL